MLWIATQSEKGDIYYYNRVTDEVRWDDPKEYVAMQDQLEDMVKIQQAKTVQTCIRIGLNAMLREYLELWYKTTMPHSSRFFDPESSGKSVDHVRTVSKALDSWMRARDLSIRKTAENFYLQEQCLHRPRQTILRNVLRRDGELGRQHVHHDGNWVKSLLLFPARPCEKVCGVCV